MSTTDILSAINSLPLSKQQKLLRQLADNLPRVAPAEWASRPDRYPLRGSVVRFDHPTEPVLDPEDWEAQ